MFPTPTPTPFPNFVARNAVEATQIQLLHQIQTHTLPPVDAFLLGWLLTFPLPLSMQTRLNLYHALLPIVAHWSPLVVVLLFLFWEVWVILFLLLLYFLVRFIVSIVRLNSPHLFRLISKKEIKRVYLQLIFPSDTSKSAYATQQLYMLFHGLARQKTFLESIAHLKKTYSLEIVATKKEGIRFILVVDEKAAEIIKRSIMSYLPGIQIKEVDDYLSQESDADHAESISELKLSNHFALPLQQQNVLSQHDFIGYLIGSMTQLASNELIAFQMVTTPVINSTHGDIQNELKKLRYAMYKQEALANKLNKSPIDEFLSLPGISLLWWGVKTVFIIFKFAIMFVFSMAMAFADHTNEAAIPFLAAPQINIPTETLNPYEQELKTIVKEKIDQQLFETSIRIFIKATDVEEVDRRLSGLLASFGPMSTSYQSITTKSSFFGLSSFKRRFNEFSNRLLSKDTRFNKNPILSSSEIADFYHFPFSNTTRTEDMVKNLSQELSAPLSLKQGKELDVVFGENTYGNSIVPIGLTDDERSRHIYMIGQTGSGKSTILFHMAKDDIQKGRGLCVVDPHGDLVDDLRNVVPGSRINDVVYVNPFDIKYPININLLELTPDLDEDEQELEKELVAESVISIFRRIFFSGENVDAHRIEYILRNTIYTAFYVKDATIFTIYKLLTNPDYHKKILKDVADENLQDFWKNEFGKAGDWQQFKMVSGVTAKVGRFLYSPIAKRMLEKPTSTIYFDDLLNQGKIILCNLSEGKLGEDTAHLIGTTIITKIHLAILKRARMEKALRKPFYLYVDEFQNFATSSFTRLLSGGRKFGLRVTIAEQSTTQQEDRRIVNVILANVGTVISFRTASPVDEELMLSQFHPLVKKGDILNLPRHHFYVKLGSIEPQEPFSGVTLPIHITEDKKKLEQITDTSRKNYASVYVKQTTAKIIKKQLKAKPTSSKSVKNLKSKKVKKVKKLTVLT